MNYPHFTNYQHKTYTSLQLPDGYQGWPIVQAANEYLSFCADVKRLAKATLRNRENALRFFALYTGTKRLEEITNDAIAVFLSEEASRGLSGRTINEHVRDIERFVNFYRRKGVVVPLNELYIEKVKEAPPRRIHYTREQVFEVLGQCQNDREWLMIRILYDTGMRIAELGRLSVEQIRGRRIEFIGKGNKRRFVFLTSECYQRLVRFIEEEGITSGRLWLNHWGYPVGNSTLRDTMRRAFRRCGYDDFHPHALRHSFASDLQRQNASPLEIMAMMGHTNVATTQRYLDSLGGQLENLFGKYRRY